MPCNNIEETEYSMSASKQGQERESSLRTDEDADIVKPQIYLVLGSIRD